MGKSKEIYRETVQEELSQEELIRQLRNIEASQELFWQLVIDPIELDETETTKL